MNPILSGLVWVGLFLLGSAAAFLPRRLELLAGPPLGLLYMALDGRRRRIAYDNIRRCLPELGEAGWRRLLKENFKHYGILGLELLHQHSPLPGHWPRYAARASAFEGLEHWRRAAAKGKGVIFFASHLGNWELMAAQGALSGIPLTMVTRHLKPEWLHARMEAARLSTGVRCAFQPRTMPAVLKSLRRGDAVVFVMDQYSAPPAGIPVPFFGVTVDTLGAVAALAARTGAPLVPVVGRRDADGVVRVILEPELDLGGLLDDPARATEALAAKVEAWIRKNPAQWLWAHRRFKNVTWPDEARREAAAAA